MKICNCSLAGTGACKTCSNYPFSYHIVNDLIELVSSAQLERKKGEWIPFKQEQNPETGRWEFVDPPEDGQHILITVNLPEHEPVQDDYWYRDMYGHLYSGLTPCDEAIAWKPMPEPYRGEQE